MAEPEFHDDLSLAGRITETIGGAKAGLVHGAQLLFGSTASNTIKTKESLTQKTSLNQQSPSTLELSNYTPIHSAFGKKTYLYEQASAHGNQNGPLRAMGQAREPA